MNAKTKEYVAPEWSHLFDTETLEDKPAPVSISPDEAERKALAKRFAVDDIYDVTADFTVRRQNQMFFIEGRVSAKVVQPCVVTLEPVETPIEDRFEAWYADPDAAVSIAKARRDRQMKKGKAEVPMLEEHEDPEAMVDGKIDLGELAAQYISLSINPYVHAEGVAHEFGDDQHVTAPSDTRKNPFAALAAWKDKLK